MSEVTQQSSRRNTILLGIDYVTFGGGLALLGPTTILPTLVRLLGGSAIVVGSLGTIMSGGWLLPQLFAGRYVANRPLVKKYILVPACLSRACLALLVPTLLWLAGRAPALALSALLLAYLGFAVGDALASVGWLELLGKTVAIERRGRFIGTAQVVGGLLAVGAGVLVREILARPGPFLANHLLLITLAVATFLLGTAATAMVHEPPGVVRSEARLSWREYFPLLGSIVRSDARFVWLIAVRWLSGLSDMASGFYVLFAADRLGIPGEMAGLFISAGVVGGMLSGLILGPLADRKGCDTVIKVVMALRCSCPTLALAAPLVAAWQPHLALGAFVLIFAITGMANGAHMVGFINFLLAIAPPGDRSSYIALANTLGGLLTAAPLAAGWLVQIASYETLFVVTLSMAALGLVVAWRGQAALAR